MIPTAEEVKAARKTADAALREYRKKLAAYQTEAAELAALNERAAHLAERTQGDGLRAGLLARAVAGVGAFLAGKGESPKIDDADLIAAAGDDLRREAIGKMHSAAMVAVKAKQLEVARIAVEVADAYDVAIARHAVAFAGETMREIAPIACKATALIGFAWGALRDYGGSTAWPIGDTFPADECDAIELGGLPVAPELGEVMPLATARALIESEREEARRKSVEAEAQRRAQWEPPTCDHYTGEAARAMLANHGGPA